MSGFSASGLERLGEVARSHVGPDRAPGLVALVAHGDIQAAVYAALK